MPSISFANQAIVAFRPASSDVVGVQPRRSFARAMSGRRRRGSSTGSGRLTMRGVDPDSLADDGDQLADRELVRGCRG